MRLLLLTTLISLSSISMAQTGWQKAFGEGSGDFSFASQETADSGYIVYGYTQSLGAGDRDYAIIKLDANGDIDWVAINGEVDAERVYDAHQLSDGSHIMAGMTTSIGAGGDDATVVRFDGSGTISWVKTYGGTGDDDARAIMETSDGGYIVAGATQEGAGGNDAFIMKLDMNGDTTWTRILGGGGADEFRSVQQTSDGGYVAAGWSDGWGAGDDDFFVVRFNASGDTLWSKVYGGSQPDNCYQIRQTSDGGYVATGETRSWGSGGRDVWVLRLNATGDTLWSRVFGNDGNEEGYDILQTADGGYAIVGEQAPSGGGASNQAVVLRLDAMGDTIWTREYGATGAGDNGRSIRPHSGGGFVLGGYTNSFGAGGFGDMWLAVTDAAGAAGACYNAGATFDVANAPAGVANAYPAVASNLMAVASQSLSNTPGTLSSADFELELVGASGPSSPGGSDGYALVVVTGGAWPYTYQWNDTQGQTTQIATGLAPGTYTCLVTDGTGCSASVSVTVFEGTGYATIDALNAINLMPNPSDGRFTVNMQLNKPIDLTIEIVNHIGQTVHTELLNNANGSVTQQYDISGLAKGFYFFRMTTTEGQVVKKLSVH